MQSIQIHARRHLPRYLLTFENEHLDRTNTKKFHWIDLFFWLGISGNSIEKKRSLPSFERMWSTWEDQRLISNLAFVRNLMMESYSIQSNSSFAFEKSQNIHSKHR